MTLRETQKALADWIRAPEGVARALAAADGSALAVRRLVPEQRIRSDSTLDAISRLEIYANAYFYRILGVLADDYEALCNLLGEPAFNDLVTSYLLVEPSRHPSLRYAGRRLPEFLAAHPAAEGVRGRAAWAADLAAFEWTRVDAFDAADEDVLMRDTLVPLAPEAFAKLLLTLGTWVSIRRFAHPVDLLWAAGTRSTELPIEVETTPMDFAVWRQAERVFHRRLDPLEAGALSSAVEGTTFGELCEWAARQLGEERAPGLAAGWLEQWIADGLLIAATG